MMIHLQIFEDGSTTKTIPGEGTYTVVRMERNDRFRKITTGTGTGVTVKRVDKNGTQLLLSTHQL